MDLGKKIKQLRFKAGLTQEQLAEQLGIGPQAVSKWENAVAMPDITTLPLLAEIFGVSIDDLFDLSTEQRLNRIENRMDREAELPPDVFRDYEDLLKSLLTDAQHQKRATDLLAYLYWHRMNADAGKVSRYARDSIQRAPAEKGCQWMLQEGEPVADVLFFCGEQVPNQGGNVFGTGGRGKSEMNLSDGYNWDVCAAKAFKELKVVDGKVVAPSGVKYRLLVLPNLETMSMEILNKVEALVDAGAKVCGMKRPIRAPGLRGFPNEDGRVRDIAEKVWVKGVMTCCPQEALKRLGVEPDFASKERNPPAMWIHRCGNGMDWYFVSLNNVDEYVFEASFRLSGRQPEIWDAETGEMRDAEEWREDGGRTYVTLSFPPSGSAFVVFRRAYTVKFAHASKRTNERSVAVEGDWCVAFPTEWYSGGTSRKSVVWNALVDWKDVDDERQLMQSVSPSRRANSANVLFLILAMSRTLPR